MPEIVEMIEQNIDFMYILLCNVVTWCAIEGLSLTKFKERLSTGMKRLIATVVAIFLGAVLHRGFGHPFEPIFYGFFIQYLSWDYFFKAIIERVRDTISGKSQN